MADAMVPPPRLADKNSSNTHHMCARVRGVAEFYFDWVGPGMPLFFHVLSPVTSPTPFSAHHLSQPNFVS